MSIPAEVACAAWIPFTIAVGLCMTLSWLIVRRLSHEHERDLLASIAGALALAVSLLSSALLPVDVFLVSFMKDSHGDFKDWAVNSTARETIETSVLTAYYVVYGLVLILGFLVLPFAYFFWEEKDGVLEISVGTRACAAFKYTSISLPVAAVLLTLGAVIPMRATPPQNSTEWEKIEFLVHELATNRGEDALNFVISLLTLVGMVVVISYLGSGIGLWPLGLMIGTSRMSQERRSVAAQMASNQAEINTLRNILRGSQGDRPPSDDAELLLVLEEQQPMLEERQRRLGRFQGTLVYCLLELFLGTGLALFGVVVWICLLFGSLNKCVNSLGYDMGYLVRKATVPNPLDMAFVRTQKVFPLDYILYLALVLYLVMCTVHGIQVINKRFSLLQMCRIGPGKTKPEGILLLCLSLMFAVLAFNVLLYNLCPQYTTFGSQHYLSQDRNSTTAPIPVPCTIDAPPVDCVMTRGSALLMRFFYKAWVFGACYFWATVLLAVIYPVTVVSAIIRNDCNPNSSDDDDMEVFFRP